MNDNNYIFFPIKTLDDILLKSEKLKKHAKCFHHQTSPEFKSGKLSAALDSTSTPETIKVESKETLLRYIRVNFVDKIQLSNMKRQNFETLGPKIEKIDDEVFKYSFSLILSCFIETIKISKTRDLTAAF